MADVLRSDELRADFESLARALRQRSAGRTVCFLQNDGNYGDALIRYGTEKFFEDAGLEPRVFDMSSRAQKLSALALAAADPYGKNFFFVYSGSGAWAAHCSVALRNVARQMKLCPDVFVLPSTVEQMPFERRPTIYRRDHSETVHQVPDAPFCHDMAFYLALLPRSRWFHGRLDSRVAKGVFFRSDNEARIRGGNTLDGNRDLSAEGTARDDIQRFLERIARCDHVITDRLHVGIAGVLLGLRVSLAQGRTYKIRAIYEASIAPHFDNCELVSDQEALRRAQS